MMTDPSSTPFTIVGLSVNLKGKAQQFLADLDRNRWEVMLCHDTSCRTYPLSVAAIVGDTMVGHVCSMQSPQFWSLMTAVANAQGVDIDEVVIFARVDSVDYRDHQTEHVLFTVIADFEGAEPVALPELDYWHDWGLELPAKPKSQHDVVMANTIRVLQRQISRNHCMDKANLIKLMEAFGQLSRHDLSHESRQLMTQMSLWLLGQDDEELHDWGFRFRYMQTAMSGEERIDERIGQWWPQQLNSQEAELLWQHFLDSRFAGRQPDATALGDVVTEMTAHLMKLPGELPRLVRGDGREFFKGIYYMDTPREVLFRLYGCIIITTKATRLLHSLGFPPATNCTPLTPTANQPETPPPSSEGLIPQGWLLGWAGRQDDRQTASVVRKAISDFTLERSSPALLHQLDEMERKSRSNDQQLHIHAQRLEMSQGNVDHQDLHFDQPVAQVVAHADSAVTHHDNPHDNPHDNQTCKIPYDHDPRRNDRAAETHERIAPENNPDIPLQCPHRPTDSTRRQD